jgi:hypothetical protein
LGAVTAENGAFGACSPPNFRERCKQLHGEGSERDVRSSDDDRFVHCLTTFFALRHLSIDRGASDLRKARPGNYFLAGTKLDSLFIRCLSIYLL